METRRKNMATINISDSLADEIRQLAEGENQSIEDLLKGALENYKLKASLPPGWDAVTLYMAAMGIIEAPPTEIPEAPMTPEEDQALADRIGAAGPLSKDIIAERQEGW
jgi:Ribbon-helix-helix protein, copG family